MDYKIEQTSKNTIVVNGVISLYDLEEEIKKLWGRFFIVRTKLSFCFGVGKTEQPAILISRE